MNKLWPVEFYRDARGRSPVLEFIDRMQNIEQSCVLRYIKLLQKYGPLLRMPYARHIEGKLWELRADATRVFYFCALGDRFVLLHAYRKKSQEAPRKEIERALRYMQDYVSRREYNER